MSVACKLAEQNLKAAQTKMKVWYDRKAHKCSLNPGDKVLVLLPIPGHPLQARYSGPYIIEEKRNDVNYIAQTPERMKNRRLCHINMPKECYEKSLLQCSGAHDAPKLASVSVNIATSYNPHNVEKDSAIQCEAKLETSDVLSKLDKKIDHLSVNRREELGKLMKEFTVLFPDTLGRTTAIMHDVNVNNASPCKQHPYRMSPLKLKHLSDQVEYILHNDIIEPSSSEWSLPCVLVPKPDGSYCFAQTLEDLIL